MVGIVVKNKAARSQDSGDKKTAQAACNPHAPDAGSAQYKNEFWSRNIKIRAILPFAASARDAVPERHRV